MAKASGGTRAGGSRNPKGVGSSSQSIQGYSVNQIESWDKDTFESRIRFLTSELQSYSQDAAEAPYFSTEYNEAHRRMNALERDIDKIVDVWNKKH